MTSGKKPVQTIKTVLTCVCALFFGCVGVLHFVHPEPFLAIVPDYIPFPAAAVYISGFFECAGGVGLLIRRCRHLASMGLIALLIAVFPANVNMAVNSIDFGLPHYLLWWRLPLQAVLIVWVWWCGRD